MSEPSGGIKSDLEEIKALARDTNNRTLETKHEVSRISNRVAKLEEQRLEDERARRRDAERVAEARRSASELEVSQKDLGDAMIRTFAAHAGTTAETVGAIDQKTDKLEAKVSLLETKVDKVTVQNDGQSAELKGQTKTLGKIDKMRLPAWLLAVGFAIEKLDQLGVLRALGGFIRARFGL